MSSNRRPVLKLGVVDFGVESATLPGGVQVDLAVIRHPGASAIVALDSDPDLDRRPVLKLGVVDFGVESATLPGGVQVDLAVIRHPGASAIVALDSDPDRKSTRLHS